MELAVVLSGGLRRNHAGQVRVPEKAMQGMRAYVERWPGPVSLVCRPTDLDVSGDLGAEWRTPEDQPFGLHVVADPIDLVRRRPGTVVLAPLTLENRAFLELAGPVVFVVENTAGNQARYALQSDPRRAPMDRARIRLGAVRRHRRLVEMTRRAAGLQCNGWPAWDAFARHSPSPHLYLDSRASADDVESASATSAWAGERPLRLGFSGRWVRPKGPQLAVALASVLRQRGLDTTLVLYGGGPLEPQLRAAAPPSVTFAGSLPFRPDWVDEVTRSVDVMVLPHTQADPSGTYLEALACGAPVLGFDNEYLRRLCRESGGGWAERMGDVGRLGARVDELVHDPASYAAARARGLDFMRRHTFEREFDGRVDHLLGLVGHGR